MSISVTDLIAPFVDATIAGTEGNTKVREYIVSKLTALKWHVELDSFTDTTPLGVKNFTNIIATKDPAASRRLVLSAHFDSKYFMDMEVRLLILGSASLIHDQL